MSRANVARSYEDFEPLFDWKRDQDGSDILIGNLPGFKKEQLKVQLNNLGKMTVSGERQIGGNKWSRFRKEFQVPENCNMGGIHAKFDDGTLYVIMPPKMVTRAGTQAQPALPKETTVGPKITEGPKPTKELQGAASTVGAEKKPNGKTSDAVMEKQPSGKTKVSDEMGRGPGKTTNTPMDTVKPTYLTKVKEEFVDALKTADWSTEAEPSTRRHESEIWKRCGGSYVFGLNRPKKMVVGVIVAAVAVVAIGIYVALNLRPQENNGD